MDHHKTTAPDMAKVVERNVSALQDRKNEESKNRSFREKVIDSVMAFISSMLSFYVHLFILLFWVLWNKGWLHLKVYDPRLVNLSVFASIESIFLTTFVLIGQKRLNRQTNKSAELDLQVSLLTEHELTRVMTLVTAIAKKMDIREADNKEIEEVSKDIHPEKVLDAMEKAGNTDLL